MNPHTQEQRDVNRLVDIEVREVSLVDRAANQHRFLIVKRSDEMADDSVSSTEDTAAESAAKMDHESPEGWGEDHQPEHHGMLNPIMTAAVDALQRMTTIVEMLQAHDESSGSRLSELATELHAIVSQVEELAGGPGANAPWLEMPEEDEDMSADSDDGDGALLGDAEEMLAQAKRAPNTRPRANTGAQDAKRSRPAPASTAPASADPVTKQLGELTAAIRGLTSTVNTQQQRLGRLEKSFGLPNSRPPGERTARREVEESSWPMDLNKPLDRASVDKATSFHDL